MIYPLRVIDIRQRVPHSLESRIFRLATDMNRRKIYRSRQRNGRRSNCADTCKMRRQNSVMQVIRGHRRRAPVNVTAVARAEVIESPQSCDREDTSRCKEQIQASQV